MSYELWMCVGDRILLTVSLCSLSDSWCASCSKTGSTVCLKHKPYICAIFITYFTMKTGIHFYRFILPAFCLLAVSGIMSGCSRSGGEPPPAPRPDIQEAVYDETGCLYTSYKNLVMAGYQGWFAAEGDGSERGW